MSNTNTAILSQYFDQVLFKNFNWENPRTLKEWLNLYLENIKESVSINTYNNYSSYIRMHIIPALGDKRLLELTTPMITEFMKKQLKSGRIRIRGGNHRLSAKTVKEQMMVFNKALDLAVKEGELLFNPCQSVDIPSQIQQEVEALEQTEQAQLEAQISNTFMPNSTLAAKIALHGGLRNGEVCALQMKHIDIENEVIIVEQTLYRTRCEENDGGIVDEVHEIDNVDKGTGDMEKQKDMKKVKKPKTKITIGKTKNKRDRIVPLSEELLEDLKVYISTMPKEYRSDPEHFLFVNKRGKPLEPRRLLSIFKDLLKKAGLKDNRFHVLRHTFATRCLECEIELKIVSKILGHSSIKITADLYTHVTKSASKCAMKKFHKDNWGKVYKIA